MESAKITLKGQVTVPKKVRTALGIKAGDLVIFSVEGEQAILKPFIKKPLLDFYGILPAKRKYPGVDALRHEMHRKLSKKIIKGTEK